MIKKQYAPHSQMLELVFESMAVAGDGAWVEKHECLRFKFI